MKWNWFRQRLCRHRHLRRVTTTDGHRMFVCRCGYQVPQLDRAVPVAVVPPAHELLHAVPVRTANDETTRTRPKLVSRDRPDVA